MLPGDTRQRQTEVFILASCYSSITNMSHKTLKWPLAREHPGNVPPESFSIVFMKTLGGDLDAILQKSAGAPT